MRGLLLLAILLVLAVPVLCWWAVIIIPALRARKQGAPLPWPSSLLLQFSVGVSLAWLVLGLPGIAWTLLLPIWPVLGMSFGVSPEVAAVVRQSFLAIAVGASVAWVAGVGLFWRPGPLRHAALVAALPLAAAATLALAEQRSEQRMEARAAELGAECLARRSLRQSLGFAGAEFQFDLHAVALIDGAWRGWSYRLDDFYLIPDGAPTDGNGLRDDCLAQIEPGLGA